MRAFVVAVMLVAGCNAENAPCTITVNGKAEQFLTCAIQPSPFLATQGYDLYAGYSASGDVGLIDAHVPGTGKFDCTRSDVSVTIGIATGDLLTTRCDPYGCANPAGTCTVDVKTLSFDGWSATVSARVMPVGASTAAPFDVTVTRL
jgi:hypothetical protein